MPVCGARVTTIRIDGEIITFDCESDREAGQEMCYYHAKVAQGLLEPMQAVLIEHDGRDVWRTDAQPAQ